MANPPQVPPPGVPLPQGPPPPPNRALWWVLGTIIVLLLLIIGGGLFLASRIVRGITVQGPNRVEVRTPGGEINIRKTSEDDTGLPVYPGAIQRPDGAHIRIEPLRQGGGLGISAASYTAPAALNDVAEWYRKQLDRSFEEQKGKATLGIGHVNVGHADLAFVSRQDDRLRIVGLEREGNQTKITLFRMGKQEPQ